MTGKRLTAAVIGAGEMANRVHYPSLTSFDDVDIAGICDLNEARLKTTAQRWSVPKTFTDYRQMIDSTQPDAVYAIGQPQYMYDIWVWCLERGCNLYIEKPMGLTLHQAEALAYLAEEHGAITQVGHQRRSSPLLQMAHRQCLERGPIVHAVCEFYKWAPEPLLGARDHMMDDGVHAIDTIRWICGAEVIGVESQCRRIGTPDINWIGATLYFGNGAVGYVVNSWSSGRRVFRTEMHARGIAVDADPEGKAVIYADGDVKGQCYDTRQVAGSEELYVYGGFKAKHRDFIDAVLSNSDTAGSRFGDCLKTMKVAGQILAQASVRGDRSA